MEQKQPNPYQAFYDWQVTTLMLAYDLADPIPAREADRIEARRESVQDELGALVQSVVPAKYFENPSLAWPPDVMMSITHATLKRAAEVAGLTTSR
jgi:hypothetical protein